MATRAQVTTPVRAARGGNAENAGTPVQPWARGSKVDRFEDGFGIYKTTAGTPSGPLTPGRANAASAPTGKTPSKTPSKIPIKTPSKTPTKSPAPADRPSAIFASTTDRFAKAPSAGPGVGDYHPEQAEGSRTAGPVLHMPIFAAGERFADSQNGGSIYPTAATPRRKTGSATCICMAMA